MYGELVPLGGGDPIPLLKKKLVIGRRESCDIVLRFPNISSRHCELTLQSGYWYIQDLDSRNGIRVNGVRVEVGEKRVDPGDTSEIDGAAPYLRTAWQENMGDQNFEVGAFGLFANLFPGRDRSTGHTDRFSDIGLDASYQ